MRSIINTNGQSKPSFIEKARREQIISCAIETIAESGYNSTSLDKIAGRAGISKGVISYYFHSKNELIQTVINTIFSQAAAVMAVRLENEPSAAGALRTYIESNLALMAGSARQMSVVMEIITNFRQKDGSLFYSSLTAKPAIAVIEGILRRGQASGEFRDFSPGPMAIALRAAIDAVPPRMAADADFDINNYSQEVVEIFRRAVIKE
jgi:TetR/AcrR family transcriptional regulator, fatty acid metabolism regulator protein